MEKRFIIIVLMILSSILFILSTLERVPLGPFRLILGLILGLLSPGYLLIRLSPIRHVSLTEELTLSVIFSISIISLVGYLLNLTVYGINEISVNIVVSLIVLGLGILNLAIRSNESKGSAKKSQENEESPWEAVDKIAFSTMLVLFIIAGYFIWASMSSPVIGDKFTEVYILNSEKRARDYPEELFLGENTTIWIGVVNREGRNMSYFVEVWLTNITFTDEGDLQEIKEAYLLKNYNITLPPLKAYLDGNWTAQWEQNLTFSIDKPGKWQLWVLVFKGTPPTYLPKRAGNLAALPEVRVRFEKLLEEHVVRCKMNIKVRKI